MGLQLDGVRLKIQRAQHHIADFESRVSEFLIGHPYSFIVDTTSTGDLVARYMVRADPALPSDWSGVIGDAAHNLRSAIDHVVCAAARRLGASLPYEAWIKVSATKVASGLAKADKALAAAFDSVIQRSLGPYRQSFYELHRLDIEDKHKALVLACLWPPSTSPSIESAAGSVRVSWTASAGVLVGVSKTWYSVGDVIPMCPEIVFRDPPCKDKLVLDTLREHAALVEKIVQEFQTRCP